MQRDIVYRNIAATHIAYDMKGMLHGEISHGNFIIFHAFLAHFWFFSASERVIICDYKHLESLFTLIKIVNEVQKKEGKFSKKLNEVLKKILYEKKKKKKRSKLIKKYIILVSIQ